ncbi:MAG: hypothetical protein ACI4QL_04125 [Candidatus Fimimonas sp.]
MTNFLCSKCHTLTTENSCPNCHCKTAPAQADDVCFFAELSGMSVQMLAEVLSNNGIEFIHVPYFFGYSQTNTPNGYRFFVRYKHFQQAANLYYTIFGNNSKNDGSAVIGSVVQVVVDRPLGSVHPNHSDIVYGVNYGFVEGVLGGDGEAQDAYVLGVDCPVESFEGEVIAIIVRHDDVETKWVVAPKGKAYSKEEIAAAVEFQEKFFHSEIITENR